MSLYSWFDRKVLFPIGEKLLKRDIKSFYKDAVKTEWLGESELYELQCQRLQKLIAHCYKNVPYYRNLFEKLNLTPDDIKCREDLVKLPILTKDIVREHYDELISADIEERKYFNGSSGGSTGTPLRFIEDINTWNSGHAYMFHFFENSGYKVGERMFTLAGNSLVQKPGIDRRISFKDIYDVVLMRNKKHDCTDITPEAMAQHYKAMMKYKPVALRGYASSLYFLARYIEQNRLPVCKVKVIFTTGEKLMPKYRYKIQQVFHTDIYDGYGASDGGVAAYECYMHEGLHIVEEKCVVEITDIQGKPLPDGEVGHVLTTDLNNYCFPFIRYKVGDMAYVKKELCSCGRKHRLLGEIIGREGRAIYNKQGRPYSSIVIDNMMFKNLDIHTEECQRLYEKMERFQIRQDKAGDLRILIVPANPQEPLSTFDYVRENFEEYFPESKVSVEFVDNIPPLPSGKDDYCVSEFQYNEP